MGTRWNRTVLSFVVMFFATTSIAQDKAMDGRPARLYFLRHTTLVGVVGPGPEIKINGVSLGSVWVGSYVVAQRPAGRYRITVSHWAEFGRFEVDVNVAPATSYYYEIGITARGGGVLLPSLAGEVGAPMRGRVDTGSYRLNVLNTKSGAASIANLKH
jgi:hypothetical protein